MPAPQMKRFPGSRRVRRLLGVAACALLLAACEGLPFSKSDLGVEYKAAEIAPEAAEEAAAEAEVAAIPPPEPEPEPVIEDDPARLIGMTPHDIVTFLGAPELIRRETPANIWQYRAEGCVLDLVLYPEEGTDRVTYVEARENGLDIMPAKDCLTRVLRKRQG